MSDVTLINPYTSTRRMAPLGILYIASYLESEGIDVNVIDPFSIRNEPDTYWRDLITDSLYVGITCMSSQWKETKVIAEIIKNHNPNVTVVVGGVYPTVAPKEVLKDTNIDIAVVGEGEKALLKIIDQNIPCGIVQGEPIEILDDKPFPAWHLINMKKYITRDTVVPFHWIKGATLITSLGCPFKCIYCINSKNAMFGRTIRYNSPEYVEEEVEELVYDYGIEGIHFHDDNFLTDRKRAIEICNRIKKFNLKWYCQARVDTIDDELARVMSDSGCVGVGFGVEAGTQKILTYLGKMFTIEDTIRAFNICKKHGIKTLSNTIIGSPTETRDDIEQTDKLLEKIKPDYTEIWFLTPYEGTILYDRALEQGWIMPTASYKMDEPQMEIIFPKEELIRMRKQLMKKHNPFYKTVRPYLNKYFIYDMLRLLGKEPLLLFKGVNEWTEASRIYL